VTPPDLDAEQEFDPRRLWAALVARWWLPVAGVVVGAIVGYLVSVGGAGGWRAEAVVYLGQPLSPGGNAQIQSLATNPTTVHQIVTAESSLTKVAADTGISIARLRAGVTTTAVGGAVAKLGQTPLVAVSVKGSPPKKVAQAANELAQFVVRGVSGYVATKISGLVAQIQSDERDLASTAVRLKAFNAALPRATQETDKLFILTQTGTLESRQVAVQQDMTGTRNLLALARSVESSYIVTHAVAQRVRPRSRLNALVIGAFVGLILGVLAALLWRPKPRPARRSTA
jgi:capsular polysaccharide biosynthesis protein